MFDQLIDGVRKASESSLQMQQEMFKQWTRLFSGPATEAANTQAARIGVARFAEALGRAGRRDVEDTSRGHRHDLQVRHPDHRADRSAWAEARSPDDYRRMVEDLWRKLFDLQKEQSESQFRDFQTFYEKSAALVQDARA